MGLDVGAIGYKYLSTAVSADEQSQAKVLNFGIKNKTKLQFRAGHYKIPHLQQYSTVACKLMTTTINQLFNHFKLKEFYQISWGTKLLEKRQGIYIVSTSDKVDKHNGVTLKPSFNETIIEYWIAKLPNFKLDNSTPTLQNLKERLSQFWLRDESILYIGKAPTRKNGSGIGKRVTEYFNTAIGDGRPHSGGQWIKVLSNLNSLFIYYAPCDKPGEIEDKMLEIFMNNVSVQTLQQLRDKELPMPFANLRYKPSIDKKHGLKNQRL